MLFRTYKGELIEINKYDYPNDNLYYQKIINIKKCQKEKNISAKLEKTFNDKNNK
jgi:hypothetical protein